jgi:hypothetical protein
MNAEILSRNKFLAKRDVFAIGGAFRIMTPQGRLLLYSRQKLFKLKEDIRIYYDIERQREALNIKARQMIDFSAAYDVVDSQTKEKIGALRRKGFHSMVRDKWEILDKDDNLIARIEEDSMAKALVRRFLFNLLPQSYSIKSNDGKSLGTLQQFFNPFIHKFSANFLTKSEKPLNIRLGLAAVILLLGIEGRQH